MNLREENIGLKVRSRNEVNRKTEASRQDSGNEVNKKTEASRQDPEMKL